MRKRLAIIGVLLLLGVGITFSVFLADTRTAAIPVRSAADIPALRDRMLAEAQAQHYEEAGRLRDLIHHIEVRGSAREYEGRGHMNRVLYIVELGELRLTVTGWKILGYFGILMFGARWLYQAWYRKRFGTREIPTFFWVISLSGAGMVTMYFIWGKNDSVGILSNALPATVALFNLVLDLKQRRAVKG
ncbi:MAG: lipid-A-disaccharide synthase N-terminal domain-containing protein [Planctomycetota bacterium]